MRKSYGVQKLVSKLSLMVIGFALLLGSIGIAISTPKSSKYETTGRIRQGTRVQQAPHNFVTLKDFKSELNVKVKEYQKVAAYTSLENSTQTMSYKANGTKSKISGLVQVSHGQSMIDHKDGTQQVSQSVLARLSGAISDNYTLMGQISGNRDLKYTESERLNGVSDLPLFFSQKHVELTDWLKGGYSIITTVPLSRYSTVYQNYQGGLGLSYGFSISDKVLAKGLSISTAISASRNFHKYETDKAGTIMNEYGMKETLSTAYELGSFTFSFEFIHRHAWNYAGSISQTFEHTEEVSYALTKQWGLSLGHTNSGSWLTPNGLDSNLKLINENDSIMYGSMSVMF